jgi:hypothetical protein
MAKNRQNQDDVKIRYLVREGGGRFGSDEKHFVIEIPAHWKVTFSSVNPNSQQHSGGYCLRVYEGEKLRAVYCDIIAFRDLSIPYAREVSQSVGSRQWESDSEGNFSEEVEISVNRRLEGNIDVDAEEVKF